MNRTICRLFLAAIASMTVSDNLFAQEWTRFRGPNGAGQSDAANIPIKWTENDHNWRASLPGIGHGSPVIWGKRIFLISADPDSAQRHVLCLGTADGKILWDKEFASEAHHLHAQNSFASCTPAVDKDRLYVAWSTPSETTFMALSHDGEVVWERELGPFVSMHGFGTSPMIYGDMVILASAQQSEKLGGKKPGKSFVIAVDRATGEIRWNTPRESAVAAYGVPCVYNQGGKGPDELIFTSTSHGFASLDPKTGKENWSIDVFDMRTVSSPVIAGGLVFGTTGSGGGGNYVVAVRPGAKPEIAYRIDRQAPYVPTPIAHGDLLFLWYDKGIVTCVNASDGKQHWQKRVGGGFSGSPVRVGAALYCINQDGEVIVIAADKQYQLLSKNPLGEPSRATPAVAAGRMYLRSESHLISIGGEES